MSNDNEMMCFVIGLGVGAATAFLFAPKSGAETRQLIQSKAAQGSDFLKTRAANAVNTAADAVERSSKTLRHKKENVMAAVEAGKAAFEEAAASTPA